MFGYHDVPNCVFDIWSPAARSVIENRAFSAYCKHQQECEDIIQAIRFGYTDFDLDDCFNESDLKYIKRRLVEYGIHVNLTLY